MVAFYLILLGVYLYYSKSKYSPHYLIKLPANSAKLAGSLLLLIGTAVFVYNEEWATGLLLALAACSLAATLIPFTAVLGKRYFVTFVTLVHILLISEILYYAG